MTTAIPGISVPVTFEDLKHFRKSYRVLPYLLTLKGYAPNNELAGDDKPETVAALMSAGFGWAGVAMPALDQTRTSADVLRHDRLTPESGHDWMCLVFCNS